MNSTEEVMVVDVGSGMGARCIGLSNYTMKGMKNMESLLPAKETREMEERRK
jgi:hypothetical protein